MYEHGISTENIDAIAGGSINKEKIILNQLVYSDLYDEYEVGYDYTFFARQLPILAGRGQWQQVIAVKYGNHVVHDIKLSKNIQEFLSVAKLHGIAFDDMKRFLSLFHIGSEDEFKILFDKASSKQIETTEIILHNYTHDYYGNLGEQHLRKVIASAGIRFFNFDSLNSKIIINNCGDAAVAKRELAMSGFII